MVKLAISTGVQLALRMHRNNSKRILGHDPWRRVLLINRTFLRMTHFQGLVNIYYISPKLDFSTNGTLDFFHPHWLFMVGGQTCLPALSPGDLVVYKKY